MLHVSAHSGWRTLPSTLFLCLVLTALALAGCDSGDDDSDAPTSTLPATNTPTQAAGDGATPSPAPESEDVQVPASVEIQEAFPRLPDIPRPVAMVEVPGERRMIVASQDGLIVSFEKSPEATELATVLDLRGAVLRDGFEEGLLGLVLAPDFERSGYVYLYYNPAEGELRTVLSRFETAGRGADLRIVRESELVLLTVPQPFHNHNGGQLAFGPDGMLYLALGDGGAAGDPEGNAQDISRNLLGSIIRIDVSNATPEQPYAIPPDNPFAGQANVKQETWAYGLRNPWRFSFDRETGDLWAGDVGQGDREEIDLIEPGGNYGWPVFEGTNCFRANNGCDGSAYIAPVAEYTHEGGHCSVTGGYVYRGSAVPELRGVYIYGDYCTGAMWGFAAPDAAAGKSVEPVQWIERGPMIASFAEDLDGELYILSYEGRIYRVTGAPAER